MLVYSQPIKLSLPSIASNKKVNSIHLRVSSTVIDQALTLLKILENIINLKSERNQKLKSCKSINTWNYPLNSYS